MKVKTTSSFYLVGIGVFDVHKVVDIDDEIAEKLINEKLVEAINEEETYEPTKKEETEINTNENEVEEVINADGEINEDVDNVIPEEETSFKEETAPSEEETKQVKEKAKKYYLLKVAELRQLLNEKGIEIPDGARKKDLLALLNEVE